MSVVQPDQPSHMPDDDAATPWRDAVAAYHDGEADAATCAEVEALLAQSAAARAYLAELRTLDAALEGYAATLEGPSAELLAAGCEPVLERAAAAQAAAAAATGPRRLLRRLVPVMAAAAAVLLVVGLALLVAWSNHDDQSQPRGPVAGEAGPTNGAPSREGHNNDDEEAPRELLEMLDLLASDLDFETLAALEPDELAWLTDVVYYDALSAFDEDWED